MAKPPNRHSRQRVARARDAGLRRISVTTRVLVAGSVAGAGMFSALAAWAQPGHGKAARSAVPRTGARVAGWASTGRARTRRPSRRASSDGATLSPPATPPTRRTPPAYQYSPPAYQYTPPVVVSGGS